MPWNQTTVRLTGFKVTAQVWEDEVVENFKFLEEVSFTQFTANVTVTTTTEGTATTVVAMAAAKTFEAVPHLLEFSSARILAGVSALRIAVFDGGTNQGLIGSLDANTQIAGPLAFRFTPTAASHQFSVRAWNGAAATATIAAGLGGTGTTLVPGFMSIRRVPTAP